MWIIEMRCGLEKQISIKKTHSGFGLLMKEGNTSLLNESRLISPQILESLSRWVVWIKSRYGTPTTVTIDKYNTILQSWNQESLSGKPQMNKHYSRNLFPSHVESITNMIKTDHVERSKKLFTLVKNPSSVCLFTHFNQFTPLLKTPDWENWNQHWSKTRITSV